MRKLYNDIIYFVQNHVKPVAPSNSYPSSLVICNPPSSATTAAAAITCGTTAMVQKPLNQIVGCYQSNPKQVPWNHGMGSFNSSTTTTTTTSVKSSLTVLEETNGGDSCRTKLFGVPLQSKKRLHPEYASSTTISMENNKARLVLDKDDLGLNLMPPSPC